MILTIAIALLTGVAAVLLLLAAYLLGLTLLAFIADRHGPPDGPGRRRFAILIPAHDEELLIPRLLDNLRELDYPAEGVHIHVVADNCTDRTAAVARAHGARVHQRTDPALRGKGFALRWLLEAIADAGLRYDAYVVLDADSVVSPNFLRRMDARLESGSEVVQAHYSVLNPDASPVAALRFAALAALHYLRPLGRSTLGLSCGLKGNGMCFAEDILTDFDWRWFTLAEDVEFHLTLVRAGVRVDFAPEATVKADMPVTLRQATSQNERWERGRLQLIRQQVVGLALDGLRRRSALRLDAAVEQLIPPLSVPFALGLPLLLVGLAAGAPLVALLAALSLLGQVVYLLSALLLVGAPRRAYLGLGYAPAYVAWKVGLYARALVSSERSPWIRTARSAAETNQSVP